MPELYYWYEFRLDRWAHTFQKILIISFLITPVKLFSQEIPAHLMIKDSIQKRLGFGDFHIGPDIRHAKGSFPISKAGQSGKISSTAAGITGRLQSSFIRNYLLAHKNSRFSAGDVLAAEMSLGGLSANSPTEDSGIWLAYRFEFGFGAVYKISKNQEIGITLTLLRFSRDRVSQNISGSSLSVRYRYSSIVAEAGLESRRERIAGWLFPLMGSTTVPLQYQFTMRYLLSRLRNTGIRTEWLSGINHGLFTPENTHFTSVWSVHVFYGIYF
jgi:hypothetical protein